MSEVEFAALKDELYAAYAKDGLRPSLALTVIRMANGGELHLFPSKGIPPRPLLQEKEKQMYATCGSTEDAEKVSQAKDGPLVVMKKVIVSKEEASRLFGHGVVMPKFMPNASGSPLLPKSVAKCQIGDMLDEPEADTPTIVEK